MCGELRGETEEGGKLFDFPSDIIVSLFLVASHVFPCDAPCDTTRGNNIGIFYLKLHQLFLHDVQRLLGIGESLSTLIRNELSNVWDISKVAD